MRQLTDPEGFYTTSVAVEITSINEIRPAKVPNKEVKDQKAKTDPRKCNHLKK